MNYELWILDRQENSIIGTSFCSAYKLKDRNNS